MAKNQDFLIGYPLTFKISNHCKLWNEICVSVFKVLSAKKLSLD